MAGKHVSKQRRASSRSGKTRTSTGGSNPANRRPFVVFVTLVMFMTGTSALLLALSRPPLTPDAAAQLYAVEPSSSLDVVFNTQPQASANRWQYIYVHHSRTPDGNARTLADANGSAAMGDHFVIGNGRGAIDGEIQMTQRWIQQQAATPPAGAGYIDPACISITLIGDFDRALPTNTQVQSLNQLLATLQHRLKIPADRVILRDVPHSEAGIGQYFPTTAFRSQLIK